MSYPIPVERAEVAVASGLHWIWWFFIFYFVASYCIVFLGLTLRIFDPVWNQDDYPAGRAFLTAPVTVVFFVIFSATHYAGEFIMSIRGED